MVLDAVTYVQQFINVFVGVYVLALILFVLLSWVRLPHSLNAVQRFLHDICSPYLRMWRRILPFSLGPFDLTPMIGIVTLIVLLRIINALLDRLH